LRVKKFAPSLFWQVLLVSPLLSGKAWQACAQQTEKNHSHTNSAVSCQVYVHALLVQHLQFIFSTYDFVWSKIRKSFDAEKAQKLVKIYRLCRAEEDNHWNLLKLFDLFFSFFSSLSNSVAVHFV